MSRFPYSSRAHFLPPLTISFKYIFPLLTVLMELMLDVHHLSLSNAIDFKEWLVPYTGFLSVRATAANHFQMLKSKLFEHHSLST